MLNEVNPSTKLTRVLSGESSNVQYPSLAVEDACKTNLIVSVEEHNILGGLGSAIAEYKSKLDKSPPQIFLGIKDTYDKGGEYKFLKEKHGLVAEKIVNDILKKLKKS